MRKAAYKRETTETAVEVLIELDGEGRAEIQTGIGFFDHMLTHLARHGLLDLKISAQGDLHVDPHHTVEDVGICLGKVLTEALGGRAGISRFGHASVPMDEALAEVAVDLSGRPVLVFEADLPKTRLGEFDVELAEEFFRALATNAGMTLHIDLRRGKNTHHCIEGIFKAFARALRAAAESDPRVEGVPSTKGVLEA